MACLREEIHVLGQCQVQQQQHIITTSPPPFHLPPLLFSRPYRSWFSANYQSLYFWLQVTVQGGPLGPDHTVTLLSWHNLTRDAPLLTYLVLTYLLGSRTLGLPTHSPGSALTPGPQRPLLPAAPEPQRR